MGVRAAEAKVAVVSTARERDPETGEPSKDSGSESVGSAIEFAAAAAADCTRMQKS